MFRIASAPLALMLALSACATVPATADRAAREGSLVAIGQPVRVGQLVATPETVVEDSRCPINARCVWAGRAVVSTRVDGPGWHETVKLTLGEPATVHGTSVELVSVEPGRMAGTSTEPAAYRFAYGARD